MCGVNQFCIIVFFTAVKPANNILFCIELIQRPESSLRWLCAIDANSNLNYGLFITWMWLQKTWNKVLYGAFRLYWVGQMSLYGQISAWSFFRFSLCVPQHKVWLRASKFGWTVPLKEFVRQQTYAWWQCAAMHCAPPTDTSPRQ